MKKKILGCLVIMFSIFLGIKLFNKSEVYEEEKNIKNDNMLSMMIEQTAGLGDYELETRSSWPTDGYIFNETLSRCENGSKLSWNDETGTVVFQGNVSDKCYVYFDVYIPPVLLAEWVIEQYNNTQGNNNIYYHDSSLENGAGDNSYRYAGANPNNYVCFGSDETTCPDDNLYRIIGVFGDRVKLIKWDYANSNLLGTDGAYYGYYTKYSPDSTGDNYKGDDVTTIDAYLWNTSSNYITVSGTKYYNVWSNSVFNTTNLNTNYILKLGNWADKIAETTWIVGGLPSVSLEISSIYSNEVTTPSTEVTSTYKGKIGLVYASDYGYAASPSAWTTRLDSYSNSSVTSVNWMYMGLYELTITRMSQTAVQTYVIYNDGKILNTMSFNVYNVAVATRPTFYLNSDVSIVGDHQGTKNDPYRID